jgi:hypothetical protein
MQADAAIAEILSLGCMEENGEEEEMPEYDFPDEDSGFHRIVPYRIFAEIDYRSSPRK